MNKDIKEKWIKALTSGEYKQTTGKLRTAEGFCCLGVLCDLYSKEFESINWEYDDVQDEFFFAGDPATLALEIQNWAVIDSSHASFIDDWDKIHALSELNDKGRDFKYIADIIKKYF